MTGAGIYLLDTNVVLLATRDPSPAAALIDSQFGLSTSRFRPAICEVSIGELLAFAESNRWGDKRRERLHQELKRCVVIPISHPGVHARWAEMSSALRSAGTPIDQNDIWIAAAASVAGLAVLTTDGDFRALTRLGMVSANILDPRTGALVP